MATLDAERNLRLRALLARPGLISVPSANDAIAAMIIERAGFEVVGISGSGSIASLLGKPDTGLATATEIIDRARQIAAAVSIPVIADADTGYGGINNVRRTVQGFEAAGVSGVHLEDQVMPKKLGSTAGVAVIDAEEMVEKIRIACASRRDPNFVIIGRTDAYASMGIEETIRRCNLYAAAGADVLYPHNIYDRSELRRLVAGVSGAPLLHDVVEPHDTLSDGEMAEMGFKVAMHGRASILAQAHAQTALWRHYRASGETASVTNQLMSPTDWADLIGNAAEDRIRDLLG
jgi:2-methylisocitrate lyase-like PEP mutase family enzyme